MFKGKIIVIGDIHGRSIWKDIIAKEGNFDKVIFLGDYVPSYDNISYEDQIKNLKEILDFKEENSDKVILLRGNHDLNGLGYYWAECGGHSPILNILMKEIREKFLNLTQWIYIYENTVFSHAGISKVWFESTGLKSIEEINDLPPSELFAFTPKGFSDIYGTSPTQPLVWIRPQTLCGCNIPKWNQVVGHTRATKNIVNLSHSTEGHIDLWLCDALEYKQYLVINNNKFIPTCL